MDPLTPALNDQGKEHFRAVLAIITLAAEKMSPESLAALLHHLSEGMDDVLFEILKSRPALEGIHKLRAAYQL